MLRFTILLCVLRWPCLHFYHIGRCTFLCVSLRDVRSYAIFIAILFRQCVFKKEYMKLPVRDHRTMCLLIGLCFCYYIGIGSLALFKPRCCYLAKIAIWLRQERCENEGKGEIHTTHTHTIRTQTLSNGKRKINRVCSSLSLCWQAKLSLKPHTNSV